eukprot:350686_1
MTEPAPLPIQTSSLIGSQMQTYETLISMGFTQTDSFAVAQIFGSNVEGAINCVLTGGVSKLNIENRVLPPIQRIPLLNIPRKINKIISFRITSISYIFMTGYIRKQQHKDNIPTVIKDIIIKYFNFYFIKLNYNIKNIKTKPTLKDENKIYTLKENKTLRSIAIDLESKYKYNYTQLRQLMGHINTDTYSYFIHLWINYNYLKYIYPADNKNMKITMDQIINIKKHNKWVEIPNDFEQVTIYDIDTLIIKQNKKVLELGIEIFDIHNNKWPFRNEKMVPFDYEISDKIKPMKSVNSLRKCKQKIGILKDEQTFAWPIHTDQNKILNDDTYYHMIDVLNTQSSPLSITPPPILTNKQPKLHFDLENPFDDLIGLDTFDSMPISQKDMCNLYDTNASNTTNITAPLINNISTSPKCIKSPHNIPNVSRNLKRSKSHDDINILTLTPKSPQIKNKQNKLTPEKTAKYLLKNELQSIKNNLKPVQKEPIPDTDECKMLPRVGMEIPCIKWTEYLEIGDIIDAKDEQDKWYESVIRYIENGENKKLLYIHYIGWSGKWDEIIDAYNYKRISKRNTKTVRAHMPKVSNYNCKPETAYPNFSKVEALNDKPSTPLPKSDFFDLLGLEVDDQQ